LASLGKFDRRACDRGACDLGEACDLRKLAATVVSTTILFENKKEAIYIMKSTPSIFGITSLA
jgi:hypothetical protein